MSPNKHRFAGQVILITGASSGIGAATARAFAKEGASLMLASRRLDRLRQVAADCARSSPSSPLEEGAGERRPVPPQASTPNVSASSEGFYSELPRYNFLATDVQEHTQFVALVEKAIELFGRIDVLINNAGSGVLGPFHTQSWETVKSTLRTNFEGALDFCHEVTPHMIKRRSGVIVNVSSVTGKRSVPLLAAYSGSKFGLWGFSDSLRLELEPHGIHVCHFCPTSTATEFQSLAGMQTSANMHSADMVAAAILDAAANRKPEHIMSFTERILIKSYLVAPVLTTKLLGLVRQKPRPN